MKTKEEYGGKQNGITLIALVVTIIILLILSTVVIQTITGDNGLFGKAKHAATIHEVEEIREAIAMYNLGEDIDIEANKKTEREYPIDVQVKEEEIKDEDTKLAITEKQLVDLMENIRYEDLYYLSARKLGINLPEKKYFMDKQTGDIFINGGVKIGEEYRYILDEVSTSTTNVISPEKRIYAAYNNTYVLKEDKNIYSLRRIKFD